MASASNKQNNFNKITRSNIDRQKKKMDKL